VGLTDSLLYTMTMRKPDFCAAILALTVLFGACQDHKSAAEPLVTGTSSAPPRTGIPAAGGNISAEKWLGKWNGPEGTFLLLSLNGNRYVVKIQSLDSADTYEGVAAADGIEFTRNGKTESIHAGTGEDTGMKWLLDKKNCLIIHYGEGFCYD
jgi:hypothetical protein